MDNSGAPKLHVVLRDAINGVTVRFMQWVVGVCVSAAIVDLADRIVCIAMHSRLYKMRAIAAHVAWSASLCVCLLITSMHHAKAGEPIEMPFKSKILLAHETMYYIGRARIPHRRRHMTLWGGGQYLGMSIVGSRHNQHTQRCSQDGSSDAASGYTSTV